MRRSTSVLVCAALFAAAAAAHPVPAAAGSLEGVTLPDTATVGGAPVKLNGLGLRKAYVFVKVYVAGLYLATPTKDASAAIGTDEPKRLVLQFLREVPHTDMLGAWKEGFAVTGSPAIQPQIAQFEGYFTTPIKEGEQYQFDYLPGTGTTVTIAGKTMGTIPGADFMKALFGIWLGPKPPSADLKSGLLGGS